MERRKKGFTLLEVLLTDGDEQGSEIENTLIITNNVVNILDISN